MGSSMNREQRRAAEREIKRQTAKGGIPLATADAAREALQKQVPHLFLAYVHPGIVHEMWMMSVLSLIARSPGVFAIRPAGVHTGPLLSRARNTLVEAFLQSSDDYLLFTDTDMVFTFEDVKTLVETDAPIAGALYYSAATGIADPWCTALVPSDDDEDTFVPLVVPEPDAATNAPAGPIEVACVGMGLTLIRREVVEALAPVRRLWPFAETVEERGYGEDLTFCLRAAEEGFKTVVVPAARVGHIKEIVV